MRTIRAIVTVGVASLFAAGCATTGYQGYGQVDRSGLSAAPENPRPGACYDHVVLPPVVKTSYKTVTLDGQPAPKPRFKRVKQVVTERVPGGRSTGGGGEVTRWVQPGSVPPGGRVLAQRASDGLLLVVVSAGQGTVSRGGVRRKTVTKLVRVDDGPATRREKVEKVVKRPRAVWAEVLCDTPSSAGAYRVVQQKLTKLGFYDGPIDGRVGRSFKSALVAYQEKHRLAAGGLTRATARRLGVRF